MHEFRVPGVIHFGWGAVEKVGQEAARLGKRALLVTGRSAARRTGALDKVERSLSASGVESVLFDRVESDPSSGTVDQGAAMAREEKCDLVIGLGGGSPMDAARAIAAMAVMEGSILDYLRGKPIDRPGLPLINISMTAGTASEITPVSVVLDEERRLKFGIKSPLWFARVAITDPELTVSMPPRLTAATGLDTLTHAIESYLSTRATVPTEALAIKAVRLAARHLRAAFRDGADREAREGMAMASMTAGMAFANSGLGLVHGLVHPLGARWKIAHGEACGRLLAYVMEFNLPAAGEKLAEIAAALTGRPEASPEEGIAAVRSLVSDLGVPCGISDLTISEEEMAALARDGLLSGSVKTNPRPVSESDSRELLERAHRG